MSEFSEDEHTFSVEELSAAVGIYSPINDNDKELTTNIIVSLPSNELNNFSIQHVPDPNAGSSSIDPAAIVHDQQSPSMTNINNEVEFGDFQKLKKRNKRPRKDTWKDSINKCRRMEGKPYCSRKSFEINRDGKQVGPPCTSKFCIKSENRNCQLFKIEARKNLFSNYWSNMDWAQKRIYVNSLVDLVETKQKTTLDKSRRSSSYVYFLKLDNEKKQVCQKMFLSTLNIKQKQVQYWLKNRGEQQTRQTQSYRSFTLPTNVSASRIKIKDRLKDFFQTLPKLPSHYCRKRSKKLYLEPSFKSKRELYNFYKEQCVLKQQTSVSQFSFDNMFSDLNIGIFHPKNDQCDTCSSFKVKQITEEFWNSHILKKNLARISKASDKKDSEKGLCHTITMDVQSVKLTPNLKANAFYWKRKLCTHNFTLFDLTTHVAKNYWWNETQGDLQSSTFASCVLDFLNRYDDDLPLILYSDGCVYQNRNTMMSTALLMHSINTGKIIYRKFLEKGHTQMEVDSVHSCIETELPNKEIYVPTDYVRLSQSARKNSFPYESVSLSYDFFTDFTKEHLQFYRSIRPGSKKGDPTVTDIRCLKYSPSGSIEFKLNYGDAWTLLPRKFKNITTGINEFPKCFSAPLPINADKWKDLQELKLFIPDQYHEYYDSIPHKD